MRGHDGIEIHTVDEDGHCFFTSLQTILAHHGVESSVPQLRSIVARTVLNESDEHMTGVVMDWIHMYRDAVNDKNHDMLLEYAQVQDVRHPPNTVLTPQDRRMIYHRMMTNEYWGDETAIRIIQKKLQMYIVVIDGCSGKEMWNPIEDKTDTDCFCCMVLHGNHYEPVACEGEMIFYFHSIPEPLKRILRF